MIWSLFKKEHCSHVHVTPDVDFAYCPDCGELIENRWYLIRCSCCGIKLKGIVKNGEIIPEKKFCRNCGSNDFIIERINKINFIDISYAVLLKAIVLNPDFRFTQSWVDKNNPIRPKLLNSCR